MYISLSDEAMAMVEDLQWAGVHGGTIDEVATRLVEDQLKYLMGTPGWSDLFERKRRERKQPPPEYPPPLLDIATARSMVSGHLPGCDCDQCIPF